LCRLVEAKEAENAALRALLAEERTARIAEREARERLQLRLVELERRLGMDSSNSGTPTSKESISAATRRKAARQASQRERSKERKPGGQKGRTGAGLEPAREPDRTEQADPPTQCSGCGAPLAGAEPAGRTWGQVWDLPPITLEKVHWLLPRLRCGCCGTLTTADPPFGQAGTVMYGPNINAAAILLGSQGNVPIERTAALMEALLTSPVSPGFVAKAHQRFAERLEAAGFDAAMTTALRAEEVLCGDETPVNVLRKDLEVLTGVPKPGSPHVVTLRTPDERLIWYAPIGSRTKVAIADLGVLEGYAGHLVRDDYAAWQQFDAQLAGVQQCCSHLIRYLKGVHELHPHWQAWADEVAQVLREANAAVGQAIAFQEKALDPDLLADLRRRYDTAVGWGEITNRHRDWDGGKNHPGYVLARRLAAKAEQVWLFTRNFAVPWTNNASEQALKGPKRHQAVSGYWHTMDTLGRYCRVRSYLVTTKGHGIRAIDAIHAALAGCPWLPTPIGT
jgi:transposase